MGPLGSQGAPGALGNGGVAAAAVPADAVSVGVPFCVFVVLL